MTKIKIFKSAKHLIAEKYNWIKDKLLDGHTKSDVAMELSKLSEIKPKTIENMLSQYIKIERDYNGVIVDCTSRIPLDISKVKIKKKKPNCHLVANINDDWSLCRFLLGDYPFKTCTNTKHNNSQYCETHYNICYDVKRSNRVII